MPAIPSRSRACTVPVAIYSRVPTANQVGGRFDSCESQAAVCRDFIAQHASDGWFEMARFSDPAYSGGSLNRPGIRALMRQIEAGEIKIVVIFKLERVLRSTDEWGPFRAFLKHHGCQLVSATEDISEATPSGRLKNNIVMSVNEYIHAARLINNVVAVGRIGHLTGRPGVGHGARLGEDTFLGAGVFAITAPVDRGQ